MNLHSIGILLLSVLMLTGVGCSKVKFYAVDRPRVDQANMGNAGYVAGEKKSMDAMSGRQTRRIYVFEVDRKKKEQDMAKAVDQSQTSSDSSVVESVPEPVSPIKKGLTIPYIGDDEPTADQSALASSIDVNGTLYTVLKDDTLQKISKKVYGVYSKWTKIYDANKDKIKNPNFVKPGIVIVIPPVD